jgi:hypothetical protein
MAIIRGSQISGSVASAIFAATASYALNSSGTGFPFSGSAVITGSLLVTGASDSLFLIKNAGGSVIFEVSQSGVLTIATQSATPSGTAPNGGITFTTTDFFVGLD